MKNIFSIVYLSLILLSCNGTKSSSKQNVSHKLQGEYKINSLNNKPISEKQLNINFDDSKKMISGFLGCNRITGSYSLNETKLHFSKIASTKKFCPDVFKLEKEIMMNLSSTEKIIFKNEQTIILQGNDNTSITIEKNK